MGNTNSGEDIDGNAIAWVVRKDSTPAASKERMV